MKTLFKQIWDGIGNMTNAEFQEAYEEAKCGDLRWALEYAWNLQLDEFLQWRLCMRYMWE